MHGLILPMPFTQEFRKTALHEYLRVLAQKHVEEFIREAENTKMAAMGRNCTIYYLPTLCSF